jgi:hypothetical protein
MRPRHHVKIYRPGTGGHWDDAQDKWIEPTGDIIVHDGLAWVQDAGEIHPRTASGMPHLKSDATVILQEKEKITLVEPGDSVEVTYQDNRKAEGKVLFAREIDAVVLVLYL